jgi:hypothetical protein
MKKFFERFKAMFRSEKVSVITSTGPQVSLRWQTLMRMTGSVNDADLFNIMLTTAEWMVKQLDSGRILGAMDPSGLRFHRLVILFPNFIETAKSQISPSWESPDGSEDGPLALHEKTDDMIAELAEGEGISEEDLIQKAVEHYRWCREQKLRGFDIGAQSGSQFEESPIFEK